MLSMPDAKKIAGFLNTVVGRDVLLFCQPSFSTKAMWDHEVLMYFVWEPRATVDNPLGLVCFEMVMVVNARVFPTLSALTYTSIISLLPQLRIGSRLKAVLTPVTSKPQDAMAKPPAQSVAQAEKAP